MSRGNLQRLKQCLMELRLPTFREHHGSQASLATQESWSYPQYLLALSELEVADRQERRIQKLRRVSKLPWDKSLTSLDRSRLPQSVDRQVSGLVVSNGFMKQLVFAAFWFRHQISLLCLSKRSYTILIL